MNIIKIEDELKKRLLIDYKWGQKQNNYYDAITNFIYKIENFEDVLKKINERYSELKNKVIKYDDFYNYSLNRWYNFWSSQAIEYIFCSCPGVNPALNNKNRLVDFTVRNICFDHKTSVFPKNYSKSLDDSINNPKNLILWLYKNQSQQKRFHLKNRLFIIVFSNDGEHWKVKSEISLIKEKIYDYIKNFDEKKLIRLSMEESEITLSDIIWVVK